MSQQTTTCPECGAPAEGILCLDLSPGHRYAPPREVPRDEVVEAVRVAIDRRLRDYDFVIRDGTYPADLAEVAMQAIEAVP